MFNANAEFLIKQLAKAGYIAMFVGGCVRDYLLGIIADDIDIATDALPDEAMGLLETLGILVVPTGIKHGTVTAVLDGVGYQITTLRRDARCDGRHAEVQFSRSIEEDSNRRDFTFNAIYMELGGALHDFHNGEEDLRAGSVRFIGDAGSRIREDFLRILRYFRFWGRFSNYQVNNEYLEVIASLSENINSLSRERVGREFLKILSHTSAGRVLNLMDRAKVLDKVIDCDISRVDSELFACLPPMGKLSIINRDADVKRKMSLSNKELKLLKFFQKSISV